MNRCVWLFAFVLGHLICPGRWIFASQDQAGATPPNIVLINLDDADQRMFTPEMLTLYPSIKNLAENSLSFSNLHVTTPFCGPSRASLFRGQYAHRTGVRVNIPESPLSLSFKGGYREFLRQGYDKDELGVWMNQAGYRTMMIGKYHHNGFDFRKPPGWDDFYMSNGGRYHGTYRFTTRESDQGTHSQNPDDVYRTDQETEDAIRLIQQHVARSSTASSPAKESSRRNATDSSRQPFFLYLAPLAPHRPVGPDFTKMVDKKKYGEWESDLRLPVTPDFDESQMSDKPLHRQSPPYSDQEIEILQSEYVSRARAVKSVDDMLKRVMATLSDCELTDSTYIFFTSDNGYQLGQHRLHNKLDPYQMCTNVPLYVAGPNIASGKSVGHLLAHIDICPTILELAGVKIPEFVDGKSFLPLLTHPLDFDERSWRSPVIIENWQSKRNRGKKLPGAYSGLRYYDQLYVEWVTGDKEFYDLATDPFLMENRFVELNPTQKRSLKNDLIHSRNVSMAPIVTVLPGPIETGDIPQFIRGRAEDDQTVKSVSITIRNKTKQEYWNGTDWQTEPVELPARLSADDQQMVAWEYPFSPEKPTALSVTAWATDADSNISTKISKDVTIDSANREN